MDRFRSAIMIWLWGISWKRCGLGWEGLIFPVFLPFFPLFDFPTLDNTTSLHTLERRSDEALWIEFAVQTTITAGNKRRFFFVGAFRESDFLFLRSNTRWRGCPISTCLDKQRIYDLFVGEQTLSNFTLGFSSFYHSTPKSFSTKEKNFPQNLTKSNSPCRLTHLSRGSTKIQISINHPISSLGVRNNPKPPSLPSFRTGRTLN